MSKTKTHNNQSLATNTHHIVNPGSSKSPHRASKKSPNSTEMIQSAQASPAKASPNQSHQLLMSHTKNTGVDGDLPGAS